MQIAGQMGWTEREYWLSTPRFFYNAWVGWQRRYQVQYETERYGAYLNLRPYIKGLRMADFGFFEWEKPKLTLNSEKHDMLAALWEKVNKASGAN